MTIHVQFAITFHISLRLSNKNFFATNIEMSAIIITHVLLITVNIALSHSQIIKPLPISEFHVSSMLMQLKRIRQSRLYSSDSAESTFKMTTDPINEDLTTHKSYWMKFRQLRESKTHKTARNQLNFPRLTLFCSDIRQALEVARIV